MLGLDPTEPAISHVNTQWCHPPVLLQVTHFVLLCRLGSPCIRTWMEIRRGYREN